MARLRCWLSTGHDDRLVFEKNALGLRCVECGRTSLGWRFDAQGPSLTQAGDQQRHVILNPRLVQQKRRGAPVWLRAVHERRGA